MGKRNASRVFLRFPALSVSARIGLGFAIVLALHLSVVALGHYGLREAEEQQQIQSRLLGQVEAFYRIDQSVRDLQRNVLLFAATGYDGPGERVARLQGLLREQLDSVADASFDREIAGVKSSHIETMRASLKVQETIFVNVVADRAKRRDLLEGDFPYNEARFTSAIESLLSRAEGKTELVYAAQSAFNSAQLNALRFANSPDSDLVTTVKRRLREVVQHLESLDAPDDHEATVAIRAASDFEAAFIQMVQATRGYLHLVNVVLAGESAELLYEVEHIRDMCSASAARLTSEMQRDSSRFELINTTFSLLTIALGLLASWLIARTIAPPLNVIAQTLDGLAQGKSCEQIPGIGRRDELGKLAHAAEVFRSKAAETEQLLTEVTRMKELERQLAQSQRLDSMGLLAAGVAHEINTPMQSIVANVEFVSGALDEILDVLDNVGNEIAASNKESTEILENIDLALSNPRFRRSVGNASPAISDTQKAANRVVEIIHAMKTMSHPGKGGQQPTDINSMVKDAVTVSSNRWKYVATLDLDLDEHLPHPYAHAAELSQVALNLVVNAADAVDEKKGDDEAFGKIVVRTYHDDDTVCIEFEDSGFGIPADRRDRVFEMFYTTKEVGKGTGQGLALCYDVITRKHRGSITIEDGALGGARFVVRLPIVPEVASSIDSAALAATGTF
ncbi:Sensor histidine kinase TmoS [Botrimarina hoheduenensis]|uniref:histidine kinase n=2 Tax=Botrimarina hoheduenensis TaxID=2528000 RepID=A0A5C5VQ15_9BACT|nr:Sensor histidine kinase TmoS [Botrimarina hoheduenensis]